MTWSVNFVAKSSNDAVEHISKVDHMPAEQKEALVAMIDALMLSDDHRVIHVQADGHIDQWGGQCSAKVMVIDVAEIAAVKVLAGAMQ